MYLYEPQDGDIVLTVAKGVLSRFMLTRHAELLYFDGYPAKYVYTIGSGFTGVRDWPLPRTGTGETLVVLRPISVDKDLGQKVIGYAKLWRGTPYDFPSLGVALWRIFKRFMWSWYQALCKVHGLIQIELFHRNPQICSEFVVTIYEEAGIHLILGGIPVSKVLPDDILASDILSVVGVMDDEGRQLPLEVGEELQQRARERQITK
jgi:hypothetical protein